MVPWVVAAHLYAYEDILGSLRQSATAPPVMGPSGTAVFPSEPPKASARTGNIWTTSAKIGLAIVAFVIVFCVLVVLIRHAPRRHEQVVWENTPSAPYEPTPPVASEPIEAPDTVAEPVFGPVIERELPVRFTGTNQFLDLDTQQLLTPPPDIADVLTNQPGDETRYWEALDIPANSRRFKYPKWLQESGVDLMYAGNGKIVSFDVILPVAHGDSSTNWDDWDGLTPEQARTAVEVAGWGRRAIEAASNGEPAPTVPPTLRNYSLAATLDSREPGGPTVNLLTRDQSVNWFFKTREGAIGVMQLVSFTDQPPAAKIRYKLIQQTNGNGVTVPIRVDNTSTDVLESRMQAAVMMTEFDGKNTALTRVANDAAKAGNPQVAIEALQQINDFTARSQAGLDVVRSLVKRNLRKQALEVAKTIQDYSIKNQALAELAQ